MITASVMKKLISAPSTYSISKLLQMGCLLQCGAYFKVREINHIRFQSFFIVFFRTNKEHKMSHSIKPKNMKISKHQYFYCSIVNIIFPYAFWFKYCSNIVKFLTSTAFTFVMFIRGEVLISMWMSKDTFLLEGGLYLKDNAC